jgi:hypothetical protein
MSYKLSLDSGASCRKDGAELFNGYLCSCRPLLPSQKHPLSVSLPPVMEDDQAGDLGNPLTSPPEEVERWPKPGAQMA